MSYKVHTSLREGFGVYRNLFPDTEHSHLEEALEQALSESHWEETLSVKITGPFMGSIAIPGDCA